MADIISFEEQLRHKTGPAVCLACKHTWVAVAVSNVEWLECPECGLTRGAFKFPVIPEQVWTCSCGNALWYITPEGYMCPNCGDTKAED